MTTAILNDKQFSTHHKSTAAALEMAMELLNHQDRISAVITALVNSLQSNGDTDGVLPLAQGAEDLALDTSQNGRLIECLKAMHTLESVEH